MRIDFLNDVFRVWYRSFFFFYPTSMVARDGKIHIGLQRGETKVVLKYTSSCRQELAHSMVFITVVNLRALVHFDM